MNAQRERARARSKQKSVSLGKNVYTELENELPATVFTGYTERAGTARILALLTDQGRVDAVEGTDAEFEMALDATPFYAERGGEIADTGVLYVPGSPVPIEVLGAAPRGKLTVHRVRLKAPGGLAAVGMEVRCEVDDERRSAIRRNHTATHLLHEALVRVLGGHVRQAGSLVTDRMLRFDYTHHEPLSHEQCWEVEDVVNGQILKNTPLEAAEHGREEARALGAKALFDEKYGEVVRVVSVPGFSKELCGGLHVRSTGDIGLFKMIREESIGSGTRRVFALTGMNALQAFQRGSLLLNHVMEVLSADESNLANKAKELLEEAKRSRRQIQEEHAKVLAQNAESVFERKEVGGILLQTGKFSSAAPETLRGIGDKAKDRRSGTVVVMASVTEEDCQLVVMADDEAVRRGAHAGALVKEAAALLGGRGGGRPNMAQGGGKPARLDDALTKVSGLLAAQIEKAKA
jgi:alanyl-tRNA synthetase